MWGGWGLGSFRGGVGGLGGGGWGWDRGGVMVVWGVGGLVVLVVVGGGLGVFLVVKFARRGLTLFCGAGASVIHNCVVSWFCSVESCWVGVRGVGVGAGGGAVV